MNTQAASTPFAGTRRFHRSRPWSIATGAPVVALLLGARHSAAQESPPEPPPHDPVTSPGSLARSASATTESRWYGWQTLATDGASLSLVAGGIALDVATEASPGLLAGSLIGLGVATYTLGGPIVHFAQGNPGRGFASLALRIGLPIVLGYGAVVTICGDNRDFCSLVAIPGGAVGIATAITLDAAALARDRVSVDATRSASGLIVVPTFRIDRQHAAVGLSGAF